MKKILGAALPCVLILLVGCEQAPTDAPPETPVLGLTVYTSTPHVFSDTPMTTEEGAAFNEASIDARIEFSAIIGASATWQEAHAAIQDALATPADQPSYLREQMASVLFLRSRLLDAPSSPERTEALATYLDMLVEHRTPDGALLVALLGEMDGYWPDERVTETAKQSLIGPETFLAKRLNCEDCPDVLERLSKRHNDEQFAQSGDVFLGETATALAALRTLAARGS